ncbi:MAG: peptidyl-prolyl cis-trans isomerase cyclophilin type [Planctomycetota bacterium]|nr:MAG: peptidyl-prolyl cis-trans isomerase cyclophilin type [Planctomycetota bacterium]
MPLMNWRLKDWLTFYKGGIRHRRRPLARLASTTSAECLEGRALLAGNAIVSGQTFIDADRDGVKDAGELAARGIVVTLTNADHSFNKSVTTTAAGSFKFFRVPAGTYTLTALPGAQLSGSTVTVGNLAVDDSGTVTQNLAMKGFKPTVLSLRELRNTTTTAKLPFAAAGTGRTGNEIPTVSSTESSDVTFTAAASPTAKTVDLAGVFTDQDFQNSEVQIHTSAGDINVELFDPATPITVANFYEYATSGRYDDTIFHRLASGFVLQGGGFEFDDTTDGFPSVSTDPTIQNEFSATRSNVASTIAMAKLGGDPNSASSQFFFNLANNSANLDSQNGGFTVFGRIVGATNTTTVTDPVLLDLIGPDGESNTTVSDRSSTNGAFDNLPLDDYSGSSFPTDATSDNFLRILGVDTVRRNEVLSYSLMSGNSPVATIDTSLFTAEIINHRLTITPKADQSGQAEIVVRATDLAGESVTMKFRVHVAPVGNAAPTATVALNPTQPLVNSTLTATATVSDSNSNPVNLTYVWKRGSTVVKTTTATSSLTDTLNLSTINSEAAGDIITVEVTPNDGFVDGTKVTTTRTLVSSNTAPTATVGLTPENPLVNSVLTATATSADVNGQTVKLTYVWKIGSTTVKTTSATTNLTDTLNLSTVTGDTVGKVVTVTVTPNDGVVNGTAVSATRTLSANIAPTATVALTPASPTTSSTLTATATAADSNGQAVMLTYVWKVGNNVVKTTSATSSLTDTLDLTTVTTHPGDIVTVSVTPKNDKVGTTATDSEIIVNRLPTATASLSPADPLVDSILTATTSGTTNLTDTLDLTTVGTIHPGDTVSVVVTPNDGIANGSTATDSEVIANSLPIATVSLSPADPLVDSLLTATATKSDADGDPVTLTYVWKVGTNTVKTTSGTTSLTDTLDLTTEATAVSGNVITVEVIPFDGIADGMIASDNKPVS